MTTEHRVFSLHDHKADAPMTLRETPHRVDALDDTGALIATAVYFQGSGWGVAQLLPCVKAHPRVGTKSDAVLMLRRIVGEVTKWQG